MLVSVLNSPAVQYYKYNPLCITMDMTINKMPLRDSLASDYFQDSPPSIVQIN